MKDNQPVTVTLKRADGQPVQVTISRDVEIVERQQYEEPRPSRLRFRFEED